MSAPAEVATEHEIEVLIIGIDETPRTAAEENEIPGFAITRDDNVIHAWELIHREGYRFRIVIFDQSSLGYFDAGRRFPQQEKANAVDEPVAYPEWINNFATACPWAMFAALAERHIESAASRPNVVFGTSGEKELGALFDTLLATANDRDLPQPPFAGVEMRLLCEAGPLLFSLCKTEEPWALEADAVVVPVSSKPTLGSVGESWTSHASPNPPLQDLLRQASKEGHITPKSPNACDLSETTPLESGGKSRMVIFATAGTSGTVRDAVEGCLSSIDLATRLDGVETLVLPLVGTGHSGLDAKTVLDSVFDELDPRTDLGDLKHVIVPVNDSERFEQLQDAAPQPIVHGQKIENDHPGGDDRLGVKSEIDALADSIALKDLDPPLVIGILGGWGTGKSFAMHLLKQRLAKLRQWDLTSEGVREAFPFVGHIYLVEFDAWTYAKENLWASLIHKILFDLNHQLGLEQMLELRQGGYLLRGVDVWSLIAGLKTKELAALESDLGKDFFKRLEEYDTGDLTEALWRALQAKHRAEHDQLKLNKEALKEEEKDFKANQSKTRTELQDLEVSTEATIAKQVADATVDAGKAVHQSTSRLGAAQKRIASEVEEQFSRRARADAWAPTRMRLLQALGDGFHDKLPEDAQKAPSSVLVLLDGMRRWHKWLKGLSPAHVIFLVAALIGVPTLGVAVSQMTEHKLWTVVASVLATVGTIASSLTATSRSLHKRLEEELAAFEAEMVKRREVAATEQRRRLEQRLRDETAKEQEALTTALLRRDAAVDEARAAARDAQVKKKLRLERNLEMLQANHTKRVEEFRKGITEHERIIGLTAGSPNLRDLIRSRVESGAYDKHLGIVHRVQEDLRQISEALLSRDSAVDRLFPRGKPRVVLLIDDLDRCAPGQVVEVLEAAQLLVKTELFVAVIGMDVRYVTRSLEKQYKDILERDGAPSGLDYIEKIVQIPYRVPEIDRKAMRPFLETQMTFVAEDVEQSETEEVTRDPAEERESKIVFRSSRTVEDEEKHLPQSAQAFTAKELDLLDACCQAAEVSPRSAKRLVNVFKLLKIIWFHRGTLREPEEDAKRGMVLLLALSARQPVIMREVLRDLDGFLRREVETHRSLTEVLSCQIQAQLTPENRRSVERLKKVLGDGRVLSSDVKLETIGPENLRLVRSFSFVGETAKEFDPPELETTRDATSSEQSETGRH